MCACVLDARQFDASGQQDEDQNLFLVLVTQRQARLRTRIYFCASHTTTGATKENSKMLKEIATQNYATSVCWGDERRLEASRQWENARVQAAMDMQAGCRLHSSRVQIFSVLSFMASSGMFLQECSHSYEAKAVVDDYFLGQPGDAQYLCGLIGGLIEVRVA